MKCKLCDKESTYDDPDNLCTVHWSEWFADGLIENGMCKDRSDPVWIEDYNMCIDYAIRECGETDLQPLPIDKEALEKRLAEITATNLNLKS